MSPESFKEDDLLKKENLRLKSAVEELSILNDIATAVASTQSLAQITKMIVKKCVKYLNAEQGSIQLVDEKDFVNPFHTMIRVQDSKLNKDPLRFNKQLSHIMLVNKKPMIINEFRHEEIYSIDDDLILKIHSLISVPMIIKGKMIGILSLFNKQTGEGFSEEDKRLLSIIAAQSANVIENSRLFEEEKQLLQIQQELQVAAEIQKNILPREIPNVNGYDIFAINIPAHEVGGDYYDFMQISDGETAFALGDVSGKGLPASMLMSNLQATLRGQLLFSSSAKECITRANTLLFKSTDPTKFVTLFFGILDSVNHKLIYCNAGHNVPFFLLGEKEIKLDKGGIILGCLENIGYEDEEILFEEGSLLVVFSDGITEAMDMNEEEFGEEKLFRIIKDRCHLSSEEIGKEILNEVSRFSAGIPQSDDITVLIIKRKG